MNVLRYYVSGFQHGSYSAPWELPKIQTVKDVREFWLLSLHENIWGFSHEKISRLIEVSRN